MNPYTDKPNIPYAPTDAADIYPDTDSQPMAASDRHLEILSDILGLDFHIRERGLAVYDPVREQWLQTPAEAAKAEIERLQAEIIRLKARE